MQGQGKRLRAGAPWVFSNEIVMKPEYRKRPPGGLVQLEADDGTRFGTFMFDPHALIAARLLDRDPVADIDTAWLFRRLEAAAALRARVCDSDCHRLVNAEGDGLPGLTIDRYGSAADVQAEVPAMRRLMPLILSALGLVLPLSGDPPRLVREGGVHFSVTGGWSFDRRDARDRIAALAQGARVLDLFCHGGGFGLRCAAAGAEAVTMADIAPSALALARDNALANGFAGIAEVQQGDAFDILGMLAGTETRFDIVICDPPALATSRKDVDVALRTYGRLARLAAAVVAPGGFLMTTSSSPHVQAESWAGHIAYGLHRAHRDARILWQGGAGMDHPLHPKLPEMATFKAMLVAIAAV